MDKLFLLVPIKT